MPNTTLKFDEAFVDRLAAAIGRLFDSGNLRGIYWSVLGGSVFGKDELEKNVVLLSSDSLEKNPGSGMGHVGRFLAKILVTRAYLEARAEHYDQGNDRQSNSKLPGQEKFEQWFDDYVNMLRIQFAKMPKEYREDIINIISAYAGEVIDLEIKRIDGVIERSARPQKKRGLLGWQTAFDKILAEDQRLFDASYGFDAIDMRRFAHKLKKFAERGEILEGHHIKRAPQIEMLVSHPEIEKPTDPEYFQDRTRNPPETGVRRRSEH